MEDYLHFAGTVKLNDRDYQFVFDNYKLIIEVENFKDIDPISTDRELPFDNLYGSIATKPNYVFFSFNKKSFSGSFSSYGFAAFNIVIYVNYFCILKKPFVSTDIKIQFSNNSFQKMVGIYPSFLNDEPTKIPNQIRIENDNVQCSSAFSYKKLKYSISPGYSINSSVTHFDFKSTFDIKCDSEMDYSAIYDLCLLFIQVLRFIYYRYNVSLGDITIKHKTVIKDQTYYEELGRFFFKYDEKEIEPIELGKFTDFGFVLWKDLYTYLPTLIDLIEQNEIYLFHLPERRIERFRTDFASISTVSAAFECEFSRCFTSFESSKKNDDDYCKLKNKVSKIGSNDKQMSIISNIIGIYFESPSLQERSEFALHYFKSVLEEFKVEETLNISEIAKTFKDTRNKIDHGDLKFRIDNKIANTFYYLRIVVLCMQLTRMNLPMEKLANVIRPVLSIDCNK